MPRILKSIQTNIAQLNSALERIETKLDKLLRKSVDPAKVAIADVLWHDTLGLVSHQPDPWSPTTNILSVRDIKGNLHHIEADELYPPDSREDVETYWREAEWPNI